MLSRNERTGRPNPRRSQVSAIRQSSGLELLTGGGSLKTSTYRVLVVDDYQPWRSFATKELQKKAELQVVSEASDGLEAVQKADELQPDLIVLDLGLTPLNGIEVARRIRKLSPESKILFLSLESSAEVVQEALGTGAHGYIVKSDARSELLTAVGAILRGGRFVGNRFAGYDLIGTSDRPNSESVGRDDSRAWRGDQNVGKTCRHELGLYSNDDAFLDASTDFTMAALKVGKVVILIATDSHQRSLLQRLQARGMDVAALVDQKRYISLDVADSLPAFMVGNSPDPARLAKAIRDHLVEAAKAANEKHLQLAVG